MLCIDYKIDYVLLHNYNIMEEYNKQFNYIIDFDKHKKIIDKKLRFFERFYFRDKETFEYYKKKIIDSSFIPCFLIKDNKNNNKVNKYYLFFQYIFKNISKCVLSGKISFVLLKQNEKNNVQVVATKGKYFLNIYLKLLLYNSNEIQYIKLSKFISKIKRSKIKYVLFEMDTMLLVKKEYFIVNSPLHKLIKKIIKYFPFVFITIKNCNQGAYNLQKLVNNRITLIDLITKIFYNEYNNYTLIKICNSFNDMITCNESIDTKKYYYKNIKYVYKYYPIGFCYNNVIELKNNLLVEFIKCIIIHNNNNNI